MLCLRPIGIHSKSQLGSGTLEACVEHGAASVWARRRRGRRWQGIRGMRGDKYRSTTKTSPTTIHAPPPAKHQERCKARHPLPAGPRLFGVYIDGKVIDLDVQEAAPVPPGSPCPRPQGCQVLWQATKWGQSASGVPPSTLSLQWATGSPPD